MLAPNPRPFPADDDELTAARAEFRATVRQVRKKGATGKLTKLRTRVQRAYTEAELDEIASKIDPDPEDTLPPDYSLPFDC